MEPQLKNKDRIEILKEVYKDPNFRLSGAPIIDILRAGQRLVKGFLGSEKIRKHIYETVVPIGYNEPLLRFKDLVFGMSKERKDYLNDLRENYIDTGRKDAWAMYLGLPQKHDSFVESDYKPSVAKNQNAKYYKYSDKENVGRTSSVSFNKSRLSKKIRSIANNKSKKGTALDRTLGSFTWEKGEDERGKYISIYDRWDIHPFRSFSTIGVGSTSEKDFGQKLGVGQPWEYYDRFYYEENKNKENRKQANKPSTSSSR